VCALMQTMRSSDPAKKTRDTCTPVEGAPARNTLGAEPGNSLGTFLQARRRAIGPEQAGLEVTGHRRVAGLRREEVATLAGVSIAYYIRLEQGRDHHPSPDVLQSLARVLRLDGEAARHLQALARPPIEGTDAPPVEVDRVQLAALITRQPTPAYLLNGALDVIIANDLARDLHPSFRPGRNVILDAFEDAQAQARYVHLRHIQREVVAYLRTTSGLDPTHPRIVEVIDELTRRSTHFRHLWDRHDVETKTASTKSFVHPTRGPLTLDYEAFWVAGVRATQMVIYSPPA
jgi:transcriptional regulator with XRE-family HTH domain